MKDRPFVCSKPRAVSRRDLVKPPPCCRRAVTVTAPYTAPTRVVVRPAIATAAVSGRPNLIAIARRDPESRRLLGRVERALL